MSFILAAGMFIASILFAVWLYRRHTKVVSTGVTVGFSLWYLVIGAVYLVILFGLFLSGDPRMMAYGGVITVVVVLWFLVFDPLGVANDVEEW